jgi:hypothetical protein
VHSGIGIIPQIYIRGYSTFSRCRYNSIIAETRSHVAHTHTHWQGKLLTNIIQHHTMTYYSSSVNKYALVSCLP